MLEALVGDKCSHEHLEQISGNKSGAKSTIKQLEGCTVNIAEDQKQPKYINTSLITRIISGEPISIEEKGNHRSVLIPHTTLLFSVNEVIDFKETGLYITDRLVVIPFDAIFTDKRDIDIVEKLLQPLSLYIIATRARQAFSKVLTNGKFTVPNSVQEETDRYFMDCNNVAEFCDSFPIKTFIHKSQYYRSYCKWCTYNNKEAVGNSQFGKQVLSLGYDSARYSFGNIRNTYYICKGFDSNKGSAIYKQFLNTCGMSEEADKTLGDSVKQEYYGGTFEEYLSQCLTCEDITKSTVSNNTPDESK